MKGTPGMEGDMLASRTGRAGRGPAGRGFTMIELLVAVGLMVILLSVLAFVFSQSVRAVEGASESVLVIQKARNVQMRMGREIASAVEYLIETKDPEHPTARAFMLLPSNEGVEFVSQTLDDEGRLDTWNVKYEYDSSEKAIYRYIRDLDETIFGGNWKPEEGKALVKPVEDVSFQVVGDKEELLGVDEQDKIRLPAAIKMKITFLDSAGRRNYVMPMEFFFPIYQGH
jgi:prepilin-type N-terminal cleavage/methylation domain-containing protein